LALEVFNMGERMNSRDELGSEVRPASFVFGGSGFVGRHLCAELARRGEPVAASSRRVQASQEGIRWVVASLEDEASLRRAMVGCRSAFFLVHGLARGAGYGAIERRGAEAFQRAAVSAGVRRIVYLGGLAPAGPPSEHLRSRLEVGERLRAGPVPCIELRASMLIGAGSASFVVARDLALRLPVMIAPRWLSSRTDPLAVEDAVAALLAAAAPEVPAPACLDLPGPERVTVLELLERIARARGEAPRSVAVPVLSPRLSAYWLKLVTRANYSIARELVLGLTGDVTARDRTAWQLLGHPDLVPLDQAIARALADEEAGLSLRARAAEAIIGAGARAGRKIGRSLVHGPAPQS
jgi:uncharacterized protein YbjT (DUF2867 family)